MKEHSAPLRAGIVTHADLTGLAAPDSRFTAIDDDTYDGAPDSHCPIGYGATEAAAIADLMEQLKDRTEVRRNDRGQG